MSWASFRLRKQWTATPCSIECSMEKLCPHPSCCNVADVTYTTIHIICIYDLHGSQVCEARLQSIRFYNHHHYNVDTRELENLEGKNMERLHCLEIVRLLSCKSYMRRIPTWSKVLYASEVTEVRKSHGQMSGLGIGAPETPSLTVTWHFLSLALWYTTYIYIYTVSESHKMYVHASKHIHHRCNCPFSLYYYNFHIFISS